MIETIRLGLQAEGITVSISKLCRWFGVPRRSVYYKPVKAAPKLQDRLVAPVKAMIEENPRSATARGRTCWGSTRTPCSASFSPRAGRYASGPWTSDLASSHCPL